MLEGYRPIVVDNGSADGSSRIAEELGARVVRKPVRGFGAACYAGLEAASDEVVRFMDCDGSLHPGDLPLVAGPVLAAQADLVLGERVPDRGAWPYHARLANRLLAREVRRRTGIHLRDVGPMRERHGYGGPAAGPSQSAVPRATGPGEQHGGVRGRRVPLPRARICPPRPPRPGPAGGGPVRLCLSGLRLGPGAGAGRRRGPPRSAKRLQRDEDDAGAPVPRVRPRARRRPHDPPIPQPVRVSDASGYALRRSSEHLP
jgi:hypothetical protein